MSLPPLADVDPSAVERFGGKACTLAAIRQHGYTVPEGFAVPSRFSRDDDIASIEEELRREAVSLDADAVVVRSSANLEDATGNSFAGLFESFLVPPEEVVDAARRCYSFLEADRVINYCRTMGIDPEELRLGLVVQEVVPSESCGVCFTSHPVKDDMVVVEAVRGVAYSEQDDVTPDRWEFDADLELAERRIATQGGYRRLEGDDVEDVDEAVEGAVMDDADAREVAEVSSSLADELGYEADVEWGYRDGELSIFQARPITT